MAIFSFSRLVWPFRKKADLEESRFCLNGN